MEALNVEAAFIAWLNSRAQMTVESFGDVPKERPESFITVERTGGPRDQIVRDRPMVAIQCWAKTKAESAELAYKVDGILHQFAFEPRVVKVNRLSLYPFPDGEGNPRHQIVVEITTAN